MDIKLQNIHKSFGNVKVLHGANLHIRAGEVHALLGENGAGKSTLMNILTNTISYDAGEIYFNEQLYDISNAKVSEEYGVVFIRQELNLALDMKVYENIFLGCELKKYRFCDHKAMQLQAMQLMEQLNVNIDVNVKVQELSIGQRQIVEIARALNKDFEVIIMDEPSAALSDKEVNSLFKIINHLRKQNKAIVYISHRMKEIFAIANRVTVLRDGKFIVEAMIDEVSEDSLIKYMANRQSSQQFVKRQAVTNKTKLLDVKAISSKVGMFEEISFDVNVGEVVGIAGLMGSKRTDILQAIFGVKQINSGQVLFDNEDITNYKIKKVIEKKIAFLTEDRKNEGLFLNNSVASNIEIANYDKLSKFGFVNHFEIEQITKQHIDKLNIKTPLTTTLVKNLSGGNQQKVVFAKWLERHPKLFLMDEPTRGIDINAKNEIYNLINELKQAGISVIIVSSELNEIVGLADRILIVNEGKQKDFVVNDGTLDEEALLSIALS